MADEKLIATKWWRIPYDSDGGEWWARSPQYSGVEEVVWRLRKLSRSTMWESFPQRRYPIEDCIPLRRCEIPIWSAEQFDEYLRR